MRAHAIIGANAGDEGKGICVDHICSKGADVVVRFNGGAQAGHTVVVNGVRRVHHHVGSGSFLGIPTFLSKFFIVNPIMFETERQGKDEVYVDPRALVTIPADMAINQAISKNSSCGVGINETMQRSIGGAPITVDNILNAEDYERALAWSKVRAKSLGVYDDISFYWGEVWHEAYRRAALYFLRSAERTTRPLGAVMVFEGAQGLMLDQNYRDFPYVTHSHTGLKNVLALCDEWSIKDIHATYVTRSYLTRHGVGPLEGELPMPPFVVDDTNVNNPYQGPLRYAPLGVLALEQRVIRDAQGYPFDLAVTCLDQTGDSILDRIKLPVKYASYGPSRADVCELGKQTKPDFSAGMQA